MKIKHHNLTKGSDILWFLVVTFSFVLILEGFLRLVTMDSVAGSTEDPAKLDLQILAARVDLLDKHAAELLELAKYLIMTVYTIGGLVAGLGIWTLRDARKELKEFKSEREKREKEFQEEVDKQKDNAKKEFLELRKHQQTQQILAKKIEDLEEPSIRHEVTPSAKYLIEQYLENIKKLEDMQNKKESSQHEIMTYYDYELAAYGAHYLATTSGSCESEERVRHETNAERYYKIALDKYKADQTSSEVDNIICSLSRRWANAKAGLHKYKSVLDEYSSLEKKCPDEEKVLLRLSMAHACKGAEDYLNALEHLGVAWDLSKTWDLPENQYLTAKKEYRILAEIYYDVASILTEFAQYERAITVYEKAINIAKKYRYDVIWMYYSIADGFRKRAGSSGGADALGDYESSIVNYKNEFEFKKNYDAYFGIGRTLVGKALLPIQSSSSRCALYEEANDCFARAENHHSHQALLPAYRYYVLTQLVNKNPQFKGECDAARLALTAKIHAEKSVEQGKRSTRMAYDLAVCHAMLGDAEHAKRALDYLEEALRTNNVAGIWASEMKSGDFAGICDMEKWKPFKDKIHAAAEEAKKDFDRAVLLNEKVSAMMEWSLLLDKDTERGSRNV